MANPETTSADQELSRDYRAFLRRHNGDGVMSRETCFDRRIYLMARAIARVQYPGITDDGLELPAQRWNGKEMVGGENSVWEDFVPEAEAALAALKSEEFVA